MSHHVAKIFGDGQRGHANPPARARRLVHLPEDERGAAQHARFADFGKQLVAFARSLADAREHADARVVFDGAPNQLHDQHSLADAGAAEHPGFAAARERCEKVGYLDAGTEDLALVILMIDRGRAAMNRPAGCGLDWPEAIDRIADHVDETAKHLLPHRHADGPATASDRTAAQTRSILHRDSADGMQIEMLLDFGDQQDLSVQLDRHCVIDCRQASAGKLDVDDRPANARDYSLLDLRPADHVEPGLGLYLTQKLTRPAQTILYGFSERAHCA